MGDARSRTCHRSQVFIIICTGGGVVRQERAPADDEGRSMSDRALRNLMIAGLIGSIVTICLNIAKALQWVP